MKLTPLYIEIGLHYFCRCDEFPRLNAPACRQVIAAFLDAGLLEERDGRTPKYVPTEGMTAWIEALLSVPWPERRWVAPNTHARET